MLMFTKTEDFLVTAECNEYLYANMVLQKAGFQWSA